MLARFDVLAQPGIRYLILLEGVNDLRGLTLLGDIPRAEHEALIRSIIAAYQEVVLRARAHGIQFIGGTIAPYTGSDYYHPPPSDELNRQAVNRWIRAPGNFDAVVDFDEIMRDPTHPDRLLPTTIPEVTCIHRLLDIARWQMQFRLRFSRDDRKEFVPAF